MLCRNRSRSGAMKRIMNDEVKVIEECGCPSSCFCKYHAAELLDIARKKLVEGIPTVDLIKQAASDHEIELICTVAMLDLDDGVAEIMINEHMSVESCDVLACRKGLRKRLDAALGKTG